MKNYWLNKKHILIDWNVLPCDTIKERCELIYMQIVGTEPHGTIKYIVAGIEAAAIFETSCSGFYAGSGQLQRISFGGRCWLYKDIDMPGNRYKIMNQSGSTTVDILNFVV